MEDKIRHRILAIIPARGGSKGIPGKNLALLNGRPLIQYTIEAAKQSGMITRTIVSSDDDEIIRYCESQGVEAPFRRPAGLSGDSASMLPVVEHAVLFMENEEGFSPDYIVLLQPTSPLRTSRHIDEALSLLIDSGADSVVSVTEVPHNFNPYSVMKLEGDRLVPLMEHDEKMNLRQMKPVFYARNGAAVYAFTGSCLKTKKSIYGERIAPYLMKKEESIDIDDEFDLRVAEFIVSAYGSS